jgi:hypothetical protein
MVAVTSRSMADYCSLFAIPSANLSAMGSFLDVAAGASSFTGEVTAAGGRAIAVDPTYSDGAHEAYRRALQNISNSSAWFASHAALINRDSIGTDKQFAERMRLNAERFRADAATHSQRYVAGALPSLPFEAASFDVVLCSNFLFAYDEYGGLDEHLEALLELLRVARKTVRIHPLLSRDAVRPAYYQQLLKEVVRHGAVVDHIRASSSWLRGADDTLVLSHQR